MRVLKEISDPVALQVLCDALDERGVEYRVDDAGMRALLPLPGITDARVLVHGADMAAAERVLNDLDIGAGHD